MWGLSRQISSIRCSKHESSWEHKQNSAAAQWGAILSRRRGDPRHTARLAVSRAGVLEAKRWMLNLKRREAAAGHYRPDIDGLRAISVLPVVFYHYGVPGFSGGFVGVDIFFLISGYLITELIYAEMRDGRFSIVHFYERRIRRIFPALFAVLFVVTAVALVLLFPRDLRQYAKSLWATAVFGSNFGFWRQAGYFDTAADLKSLLHTWSLAVEEQFYLVWPALLFGLVYFSHRVSRRRTLIVISAVLVLSLTESVREMRSVPTAAFYLLPSRMWELMCGAVL